MPTRYRICNIKTTFCHSNWQEVTNSILASTKHACVQKGGACVNFRCKILPSLEMFYAISSFFKCVDFHTWSTNPCPPTYSMLTIPNLLECLTNLVVYARHVRMWLITINMGRANSVTKTYKAIFQCRYILMAQTNIHRQIQDTRSWSILLSSLVGEIVTEVRMCWNTPVHVFKCNNSAC